MICDVKSLESPRFSECRGNEKIRIVHLNHDDVSKQYLAVRVPKGTAVKSRYASEVGFIITLQDQNGVDHIAFEDKQWRMREFGDQDNVALLEVILEALAHHQAENLIREPVKKHTWSYVLDLLNAVTSKYPLNVLNEEEIITAMTRNEKQLNQYLERGLLVHSVGFPINDTINNNDINTNILVPPVYDALIYIMALSDESLRKNHFSHLIEHYYNKLTKSLEQIEDITREYIETTVRILLPVVKFQLVLHTTPPEDLLQNTLNSLKYPLINQEDVYEILQTEFGPRFELINYIMEDLDAKNGQMGTYYRLTVRADVDGSEKVLKLFVKILLPVNKLLQDVVKDGPGETEDFFYRTLLGLYKEYGLGDLVDFAPKFYLSRVNWMLVLNDAVSAGYSTIPVNKNLEVNELQLVVTSLAKFGAATLILEKKLSDKENKKVRMIDLYPREFKEAFIVYAEGHSTKKFYDLCKDAIHYIIELCPEVTEHCELTMEEIIKRTDEVFLSLFEKIHPSPIYKNVISHGDLHLGNILVHRDSHDGSIDEAILIDFQLLRYMPAVFDLLFFISLGTNRATRSKYRDLLTEDFYEQVRRHLEAYGCDPEQIFPRESFDESMDDMESAVLSLTLIYSQVVKANPSFREDTLSDPEKFNYYIVTNKRAFVDIAWGDENYRRSMQEYIMDLIEFITKV